MSQLQAGISDKKKHKSYVFHRLRQQISPDAVDLPRQNRPKSTQSEFPEGFSLNVNEIPYSNENEALKFIEEIILPYIQEEHEKLGCPDQNALITFDVLRGQTTDKNP